MKKTIKVFTVFVCSALITGFLASCGLPAKEEPADNIEAKEQIDAVPDSETEPEEKSVYEFTPGTDYSLIWSDEFDGDTLDSSKWSYQLGDGGNYGIVGWGNGESQFYTDSEKNVSVSDGTLKIIALKDKLPNGATGFTSGRIRTITDDNTSLFSTVFGRIEAKIMIEGGSGIWPAFWMLPEDSSIYGKWSASGEIDIMEVRGRLPEISTGTAHFGKQWPGNIYKGDEYTFSKGTDVSDYHIYAVEWEPDEIRWYIDDVNFFTLKSWYSGTGNNPADFTNPAPFDVPFYILLNVAVGGNFDPEAILKDESFPGIMTVDYVRVYQKNEGYEEKLKLANSMGKELEDGPKAPLKSGDSIYNGSFNLGIDHVGYWKMDLLEAAVDPFDYERRLKIKTSDDDTSEGDLHRLYQTGLCLEAEKTYGVRVDTWSETSASIVIRITDDSGNVISEETVEIPAGNKKVNAYKIENVIPCENATFEIQFESGAEMLIDNVMLMKLS